MTTEAGDVIIELLQWFKEQITRQYGEIGFIVTKHGGHVVKVEKIDRERISKN